MRQPCGSASGRQRRVPLKSQPKRLSGDAPWPRLAYRPSELSAPILYLEMSFKRGPKLLLYFSKRISFLANFASPFPDKDLGHGPVLGSGLLSSRATTMPTNFAG
jgi:hypothetical protein